MRRVAFLCLLPVLANAQWAPSQRGTVLGGGVVPPAPVANTVAWYGDSITEGACNGSAPPAALAASLLGFSVLNRGVSGESASQIVARYALGMETDCGGEQCGWYIFSGGTNDHGLGGGTPSATVATMLVGVDDALSKGREVIWFDIPPFRCAPEIVGCSGGPYAGVLKALEYNALVAAACASSARPNRHNLRCISTYAGMEAPWSNPAERGYMRDTYACSAKDRVHTSQAGANKLAALARAAFP